MDYPVTGEQEQQLDALYEKYLGDWYEKSNGTNFIVSLKKLIEEIADDAHGRGMDACRD